MDEIASRLEFQIPALRRYAFALIRNHEMVDDLVQDCLERALSRRLTALNDVELRRSLYTIMRELCVKELRRRQGSPLRLDDISAPAVGETQEAGLSVQDVFAALDALPEDQKSILLLIGVEDLSYEETARILNVPIGTVMSRLSRARQKLRTIMGMAFLRGTK